MSNLHDYAKKELEKAGYFDDDELYGDMLGKAVLDLIDKFSEAGHSGMSAPLCIGLFDRLAMFHPLSPLTGEDDEWTECVDGIFQNNRCFHVFKESKDGQAYDSEGYIFVDREDGSAWTSHESRKNIEFPYVVPESPTRLFSDTKRRASAFPAPRNIREEMEAAAKEAFPNGADGPTGKLLELFTTCKINNEHLIKTQERCRLTHSVMQNDPASDTDDYMRGMYNGMEVFMAIMDDREPEFKRDPGPIPDALNAYQIAAEKTAIYPGKGSINGLLYTILGLAGEAGEVADQTKKILRDDNGIVTDIRRDKLTKEIGDCLWYIANAAKELNLDLSEVADHNIKKLQDRQERGVLKGDGGMR